MANTSNIAQVGVQGVAGLDTTARIAHVGMQAVFAQLFYHIARGTVSPGVVKVKFLYALDDFPTVEDVRDTGVEDTTPPFQAQATSPGVGVPVYWTALAYDNNDVESAPATMISIQPSLS